MTLTFEKQYLQIGGNAMETRVAPSYANTFLCWFGDQFIYNYSPAPLVWKKLSDDIFVIWPKGQDSLTLVSTILLIAYTAYHLEQNSLLCACTSWM